MKSSSILSLLAITVSPTLSQPHHVAIVETTESAPIHSRADPSICETHHVIITDQLEEISYLKSRNLPVTHDLAGYYYAIISARRLFGCPLDVLPAPDANTSSASQQSKRSDEAAVPDSGNPCEDIHSGLSRGVVLSHAGSQRGLELRIASPTDRAGQQQCHGVG